MKSHNSEREQEILSILIESSPCPDDNDQAYQVMAVLKKWAKLIAGLNPEMQKAALIKIQQSNLAMLYSLPC
jgi:hypothetical protein